MKFSRSIIYLMNYVFCIVYKSHCHTPKVIILSVLLCQRTIDYSFVDLFLGSLFYSIDLLVYSFIGIKVSWLLQLYSQSSCQIVSVYQLYFSPLILYWLLWVFCLSIKGCGISLFIHRMTCHDLTFLECWV